MVSNFLNSSSNGKSISKTVKGDGPVIELELRHEGYNLDIIDSYQWHITFPYYTGKGYRPLKLEDYHYFSENNQFGQNMRQVKGGSIRAFQENLQQMIQLVKVHLMPLLKEVKEAHFLKKWFDKIVENDKIVQDLLKKGVSNDNLELKKARAERNEAISHIKDRWVNEVDGGRLWQMSNSAAERGLDFSLTPQLFMGISLDNPLHDYHGLGKSLKEQLDEDIYSVDITETAKESVARFMFRFYTWLPTAFKDTEVTFKLKIATLKQFYAQLQMYTNFMKPLLIEISRKSEGFDSGNFYKDFESDNPEFVNLFDTSYSFIKILGIRNFDIRGPHKLEDLEFSKYGLYLRTKVDIISGSEKGKTGFVKSEKNGMYEFYKSDKKDISREEFEKIKPVMINRRDLKPYPVMEFDFSQRRRNEIVQTPQGAQQVPYVKNSIKYKGYAWNIFEIAAYRESLKVNDLELLETFIGEIKVVKDDLLYYVNDLELNNPVDYSVKNSSEEKNIKEKNDNENFSLILGPFQGLGYLLSPFLPKFSSSKNKSEIKINTNTSESKYNEKRISVIEDTWKLYTVNKKINRFLQY